LCEDGAAVRRLPERCHQEGLQTDRDRVQEVLQGAEEQGAQIRE